MAVYPVNRNLSLNFFAARRREGDVSPCGARFFPNDWKEPKGSPGATPERTTVPLTLHLGPQGRGPRTPLRGNASLNSDGPIRRASQDGPRLCAGP